MNFNILVLPGDGIGVEVTREAVRVLRHVARKWNHTLKMTEGLLGGIAIHKTGSPLPEETVKLARDADATLMGAVGLPEFDNAPPEKRPEKGLLGIRQVLGVYANLRPVRAYKALLDSSPLKNDRVAGTDMIIVRELTGGLYYGTPRGIEENGAQTRAVNTMVYTRAEIERVTRMAFHLARGRRKKVTSVDKSNVLENSQLWRRVVTEIGREFPEVALDHILVDNCARPQTVGRVGGPLRAGARVGAGHRGPEQGQSAGRDRLGGRHAGIQFRTERGSRGRQRRHGGGAERGHRDRRPQTRGTPGNHRTGGRGCRRGDWISFTG